MVLSRIRREVGETDEVNREEFKTGLSVVAPAGTVAALALRAGFGRFFTNPLIEDRSIRFTPS